MVREADLVLVVRVSGLEQGLVNTAATSNDANHGTALVAHGLASARRQLDAGLASVRILAPQECKQSEIYSRCCAGPGKITWIKVK